MRVTSVIQQRMHQFSFVVPGVGNAASPNGNAGRCRTAQEEVKKGGALNIQASAIRPRSIPTLVRRYVDRMG
jgi:hypothetical protein